MLCVSARTEWERERDRDRNRQTDRQTGRDRERHTHRERQKERDIQTEREREMPRTADVQPRNTVKAIEIYTFFLFIFLYHFKGLRHYIPDRTKQNRNKTGKLKNTDYLPPTTPSQPKTKQSKHKIKKKWRRRKIQVWWRYLCWCFALACFPTNAQLGTNYTALLNEVISSPDIRHARLVFSVPWTPQRTGRLIVSPSWPPPALKSTGQVFSLPLAGKLIGKTSRLGNCVAGRAIFSSWVTVPKVCVCVCVCVCLGRGW